MRLCDPPKYQKTGCFLEIYNVSFGPWAFNVLRVIYLINLTGQKRYMTELKWIWPVIMSGDSPEIILSSATTDPLELFFILSHLKSKWKGLTNQIQSTAHTVDILKTESIRKLSNFNFLWTKNLYQNILIKLFYTFDTKDNSYGSLRKWISNFRGMEKTQLGKIIMRKISFLENNLKLNWSLFSWAPIRTFSLESFHRVTYIIVLHYFIALESAKRMKYARNYSGTRFCPLKIKITPFSLWILS